MVYLGCRMFLASGYQPYRLGGRLLHPLNRVYPAYVAIQIAIFRMDYAIVDAVNLLIYLPSQELDGTIKKDSRPHT